MGRAVLRRGAIRAAVGLRNKMASAHRRGVARVVVAVACAAGIGCAGAPWFLGHPLDGKPAIPPTSRAETVADHRRKLDLAHANGDTVIELAELSALEERGALDAAKTKRFIELLRERAKDWVALRRPIPLADDLRHIVALDSTRGRALSGALRSAARAAGDVWLAIGENARAEEEYRRAERLGAAGMLFRLRAAWGASPADLERDVLEHAVAELPERALSPFALAYVDAGGDEPRLLYRAWRAARVYGPPELAARIAALSDVEAIATEKKEAGVPLGGAPGDAGTVVGGGARPLPDTTLLEPGPNDRLYAGPTLARVLLPLAAAFPALIEPGARSREWADGLLGEDPTSPDSLELAALIDARAGRTDGAARKLGDLVFYSPDRAEGYARSARVWERAGQGRRACLAWEKSAHLGPADDPRWCNLVACLRINTGAGDAATVARFARERSPALTCEANAKRMLDNGGVDGGVANAAAASTTDARTD